MIISVVPAQVTSIEDKIAGNLTFSQIVLLILPVFVSTGLIIFLPPVVKLAAYKVILIIILGIPPLVMAVRINGELVLARLLVLFSYYRRPKLYLSTIAGDCNCTPVKLAVDNSTVPTKIHKQQNKTVIDPSEVKLVEDCLGQRNFYFVTDKDGRINVVVYQ